MEELDEKIVQETIKLLESLGFVDVSSWDVNNMLVILSEIIQNANRGEVIDAIGRITFDD